MPRYSTQNRREWNFLRLYHDYSRPEIASDVIFDIDVLVKLLILL